ncbi:MAG: hypothetical protein Kapaf2KO_13210 [Candidatus Kapaibacteriales bacterium]
MSMNDSFFFRVAFSSLLVSFFVFGNVYSEDDPETTRKAFRSLIEGAHPTILSEEMHENYVPYKSKGSYKLAPQSLAEEGFYTLPKFLNSSMTIDGPGSGNHQNESSIAVSPLDPDFLIGSAVDYRNNGDTWIYISRDGGYTWENKSLNTPFPTWRSTNDPSVTFDTEGNAYLMYGGFPGAGADPSTDGQSGVFISKSTDKGETWDTHIPVILHNQPVTPDTTFEDKYYVHIDVSPESPYTNHVYTPWKRVTPRDSATQIVFSKSIDGGMNWSEAVNISKRIPYSSEDTTFGQSFPLVVSNSKGVIYGVWNNGIEHGIGFNKSYDGGDTWGKDTIIHNYEIFSETILIGNAYRHSVKSTVRAEAYPVVKVNLAEGPYKDEINLVWAADNPPSIYFSKSKDEGETWSEPKIITETPENDQWWPWLGIDPESGELAVMYLDSRNDPENYLVECYVSYSKDGGETWMDRRVSEEPFDVTKNPFQGRSFAGDYSGLDFRNGIIYPSWVDMRNIDTPVGWDSDVFTAIMDTRAPSPVENLDAYTIPEKIFNIGFSWENVLESTFGVEIAEEDFAVEVYRKNDGGTYDLITTLTNLETEYEDTVDSTFTEYEYQYIVLNTENGKRSAPRFAKAFSGGAMMPMSAELNSNNRWGSDGYSIDIQIPTLRADSITPIINLKAVDIYENGVFSERVELMPTDTGRTIQYSASGKTIGYYTVSAQIVTEYQEIPGEQKSEITTELPVAVGSIDNPMITESLDSDLEGYVVDELWQKNEEVFFAGSSSLAIQGDYPRNTTAEFIFPPIKPADGDRYFNYMTICQLELNDKATLMYSSDYINWEVAETHELNDYPEWQDGVLAASDWKQISIDLEGKLNSDGVVFLKYVFESNALISRGEWLLDDIKTSPFTSVEENKEIEREARAFYDISSRNLQIYSDISSGEYDFEIFGLAGSSLQSGKINVNTNGTGDIIINNSLPKGVYFLILNNNVITYSLKFMVD